ncbi:MAG: GTPase domain-containing protein [Candidatus Heimdallarchaeota archaeon]|nr:GTPase domain-containing protein [Candidatus Heimdallarchaeota archaeon]
MSPSLKDKFTSKAGKEMNIGVLGASRVGKTTLIRYLETGEVQEEDTRSTLGYEYREKGFYIGSIHFKIYDTGGQPLYANIFWDMVASESDIIIYVLDATVTNENDPELLKLHKEQYLEFCELIDSEKPVILILNKLDLIELNPITPKHLNKYYPIKKLAVKKLGVETISAKYGTNVKSVIEWLSQLI